MTEIKEENKPELKPEVKQEKKYSLTKGIKDFIEIGNKAGFKLYSKPVHISVSDTGNKSQDVILTFKLPDKDKSIDWKVHKSLFVDAGVFSKKEEVSKKHTKGDWNIENFIKYLQDSKELPEGLIDMVAETATQIVKEPHEEEKQEAEDKPTTSQVIKQVDNSFVIPSANERPGILSKEDLIKYMQENNKEVVHFVHMPTEENPIRFIAEVMRATDDDEITIQDKIEITKDAEDIAKTGFSKEKMATLARKILEMRKKGILMRKQRKKIAVPVPRKKEMERIRSFKE